MPLDGDVVPVRKQGEGGFEAALADVAPGARDVGPHVDAELFHPERRSSEMRWLLTGEEPEKPLAIFYTSKTHAVPST